MPPVPPFAETGIPGSAVAFSSLGQLYTHSNKFPIERQITLSSTEKNFKIPILNDLKKKSKGAVIAPDVPPKRLTAWTNQDQMQPHQIYSDQTHQIQQTPESVLYRASYCPEVEIYANHGLPTSQTNEIQPAEPGIQSTLDQNESPKTNKGVTKTYHALKDIISGKFRGKEPDKPDITGLNNETIIRKPPMENLPIIAEPEPNRLNSGQVYPPSVPEPHQYNQHILQQHMVQQSHHQYYAQQLRSQQQHYSHMIPPRAQRVEDHKPFMGQQFYNNADTSFERRSAQQIERDNLKQQKNLEARRTLSHPHLLVDEDDNANSQPPVNVRRGSLGNILETNINHQESDDGGFLNRTASKEKYFNQKEVPVSVQENNNKAKAIETSQGDTPKRRGVENEAGERDRASNIDSGRGSAAYSSGRRPQMDDIIDTARTSPRGYNDDTNDQENDSEWVDIVEKELRNILEPKLLELSLRGSNHGITRSTVSGSISSITPPLPPLGGGSPKANFKGQLPTSGRNLHYDAYKAGKLHSTYEDSTKMNKYGKKIDYNTAMRGKQIFGLDSTDFTSTTTRSLDLESILDGQSDSDANLSVADTKAIRRQLEGLENMYSEVLKFLGVNKRPGANRYQPSDPRIHKKRHGSMSSLPSSSVSSVRRERRYIRGIPVEDRRRNVREPKTTARRFQRLEAHVVTLARSVAHLSSEMRTQHLVVQEIESVRQEVAALRAQTNMLNIRSHSSRPTANVELPSLANPTRVKKLTKFFGDEPPLLRLFLRKLGYEKYANVFETEKIGMVELPYLTEERLQKMGIPLGPRLRIMQEAQISVYNDNTLCIV
ncbi:unnamed protein product [Ceutorhynchus assimilis]|uniref:SAM domain-containing protein n=1 Tax=Ceutorhynchus assimilis TaxID=467358 RepID=A0A9P0DLY0_9CUCU|nr:unnamed protein product [Ceutorhynchus assimilis]